MTDFNIYLIVSGLVFLAFALAKDVTYRNAFFIAAAAALIHELFWFIMNGKLGEFWMFGISGTFVFSVLINVLISRS